MPRALNVAADVYRHIAVGSDEECWLWTSAVSSGGYGQFYFDGRLHTAHRVTWELVNGPVPDGLQLDHLCRVRRCCNPSHLDPVTGLENTRRSPVHNGARAACPQGHLYSGANLYVRPSDGARICVTCNRADARARKRRRRAALREQGLTSRGTRPQSARDGGAGCPGTVSTS